VAGLVFVDSVHDQQRLRWPPEFVKLNNRASAMYSLCKLTEPFGFVRLFKIVNMLFPGNSIPAEVREAYFSTTYRTGFCRTAADEVEAVFAVYDRAEAPASLGDLPLIVISRGISVDEEYAQLGNMQSTISRETLAKVHQANQVMQQELAGLSTQGKEVIATESGHMIQSDQPELVIDAIREIVTQLRSG
jgi:pimeloyl-ACP methyl ester carboxylesterase